VILSARVLMDWDGKAITGTINPGENEAPITKAELCRELNDAIREISIPSELFPQVG
jgi:hypothetical protein